MSGRDVVSRQRWLPWALPALFGDEPPAQAFSTDVRDVVAAFAARVGDVREQALRDAADLPAGDSELLRDVRGSSATADGMGADDPHAPMRVVLMGRTMAGKSSVLAALSGSHFDRIGDGRQRFSRDVFAATPVASDRIEVVDTPGVGASDGAEDFDRAVSEALHADLVLWVASSDSIQEETARALRLLGVMGKPIIVALNCRQSLEGVGRLNLLKFPDRVFGNREGLVEEIRRHLAAASVEPLGFVYVHALAATTALEGDDAHGELHAASRIDDLIHALLREHDAHRESRRVLRLVDGQRRPADAVMVSLVDGVVSLSAQAHHTRRRGEDLHARLSRVVRSAEETMASDIVTAVGSRRDWHLNLTDFGKSLESAWEEEVRALQEELGKTLDARFSQLKEGVEATITQTEAEWATVSAEQFAFLNLTGFRSTFKNRAGRAGIAVGAALGAVGGFQMGAAIGGALGLPAGPGALVTSAVGGVVGAGVGLALRPVKRSIDRLFLGRDGVLRKRRNEVAEQVGPALDGLTDEYLQAVSTQLDSLRDALAADRARSEDQSGVLAEVADRWARHAKALQVLIGELDKQTASVLLRLDGRERLARSVERATRCPGVCLLVELEDAAFWESWLFPPDLGERLAGGRAPNPGAEATSALAYTLALTEAPVHLVQSDSTSAELSVGDDVPVAVAATWSEVLTSHIGKEISIQSARGTSER